MPKYYRFKAFTEKPMRKLKRKEREQRNVEWLNKQEGDNNLDPKKDKNVLAFISSAHSPTSSWYMRRTSWRTAWFSRGLTAYLTPDSRGFRSLLQLDNQRVHVINVPLSTGTMWAESMRRYLRTLLGCMK